MGDVKWEVLSRKEKLESVTEDIRLWELLRAAVDPIKGVNDARFEDGGPFKDAIPALDKSRAEGT